MLLNLGLLFILVIFIGYFAAIPKDRRFDLSKAFAFVACETVIAIINGIILYWIIRLAY